MVEARDNPFIRRDGLPKSHCRSSSRDGLALLGGRLSSQDSTAGSQGGAARRGGDFCSKVRIVDVDDVSGEAHRG